MNYDLDSAAEVLRRTPGTLRALLADLPDEWLHGREADDAWSPYQVCGHLLHIEECDWIDRTRVILEHGTTQPFVPVDREAGFARFAGWSVGALLDRFAEQRATNLEMLQTLVKPSNLDQQGLHPDFGPVTLAQLLATWVVHDFNHLHQIVKTMAKEYGDAVGPWRAFLPILGAT
ncbi:MAG: DinB family protein [Frankiaceae bacterium]|nr:DinB family protein [Frankiaceae bacterium]